MRKCVSTSQVRAATLSATLCFLFRIGAAHAQSTTDLDAQRAIVARDVCAGFAANFADAADGTIEFQEGHFHVKSAHGNVTIFEGQTRLQDIPGFKFEDYDSCVKFFFQKFEDRTKESTAKMDLQAFNAGYELNDLLYVGVCAQQAAMGGFFLGDKERGNQPAGKKWYEQVSVAVIESIRRRVKAFSNDEFDYSLDDKILFYDFVPERTVGYFSPAVMSEANNRLQDVSNQFDDHVALGASAGRLHRISLLLIGFNWIASSFAGEPSERGERARQFFIPALECETEAYRDVRRKLQQQLQEMSFDGVSVPDASYFKTPLSDDTSNDRLDFDGIVTSKIRIAIKTTE